MLPAVEDTLFLDGTSSQPIDVESFETNDSVETTEKKNKHSGHDEERDYAHLPWSTFRPSSRSQPIRIVSIPASQQIDPSLVNLNIRLQSDVSIQSLLRKGYSTCMLQVSSTSQE